MKSSKQQYRERNRRYLKTNRENPEVMELPSGVQYRVIKQGEGKRAIFTSLVHVYYKGQFVDGTVFESNLDEPLPALFRVFDVIEGWKEVLQQMTEGSEYEVVIPYELGYGKRSNGNIPGYSTLIFHIQLMKVE